MLFLCEDTFCHFQVERLRERLVTFGHGVGEVGVLCHNDIAGSELKALVSSLRSMTATWHRSCWQ